MTIYDWLTRHEGRRYKKYRCTQKKWTIGVGWNMDDNPLPADIAAYLKKHGQITDAMIDRLLEISVRQATADCHVLFPDFDNFSENRRMALVDFLFNLGLRRARGFVHMIAAINTGRWKDAAQELKNSLYWKQLGGDPAGTDDGKLERPEEIAAMIEEG